MSNATYRIYLKGVEDPIATTEGVSSGGEVKVTITEACLIISNSLFHNTHRVTQTDNLYPWNVIDRVERVEARPRNEKDGKP